MELQASTNERRRKRRAANVGTWKKRTDKGKMVANLPD
jgi:hypothetical protein